MIDSHCHLTYAGNKEGVTPLDLVNEAKRAGVQGMLDIGVVLSDIPKRQTALIEANNVWHTVGIHPCHVGEEGETPEQLIQTLKTSCQHPKIVGIGETGLDKHYPDNPDLNAQIKSFEIHLEMAQELNFPVVIHARDADAECIKVLEASLKKKPFQAVVHCFTGEQYFADWAVEHGLYIGATGVITYKKAVELQAIFKNIPAQNLLIETDSPFLTPVPHRGKPNQPAYVPYVAKYLAELRQESEDSIVQHTTQNFFQLFPKAELR